MRSQSGCTTRSTALSWTPYETRFGTGWIGWDDTGVVRATRLPGRAAHQVAARPPAAVSNLGSDLSAYFDGTGRLPDPSGLIRDLPLTPLVRRIYEIVSSIPGGSTMTYADVARRAGRPRGARAVGSAMARNPLAPLVPCHRVVGSNGALRGYGGGLSMKRALLEMEAGDA